MSPCFLGVAVTCMFYLGENTTCRFDGVLNRTMAFLNASVGLVSL
jgi:hypothetical protein